MSTRARAEDPDPHTGRRHRAGSDDLPLYRQLVRTEGRLRPDQIDALTRLSRDLMADRHTKSERITPNTLVRLAVDLLLAHTDTLHGDTEDQLRRSLIPEPDTDPHPR
ncbi:hypothetical protein [Umezawaea sp. Da 62-37]|uniref:hypothetical protein n=1 Tax=Umezawaea sp. Da 62-37 TaxID=3075927 RepID=UPI0028F6EB72|nr:hypothetical protein [Umezawaea sp. Da 62-37]WNV86642.1 hypothetical protein RM788_52445 [Umezawaea sp. Da 62-37]WNV86775.1 hypothetical protein RM788_00360 [Umezawaea sp. Da 62-37]